MKRIKRMLIVILMTLAMGALVACGSDSGDGQEEPEESQKEARGKKAKGEFALSDPLIDRCVREFLNKSASDVITREECEGITSLTIDSKKDLGFELNSMRLVIEPSTFVDLSDLQYFTGLKELYILPFYSADEYVGLDAVKACKELETLTFAAGMEYVEGHLGYKYFANIVSELPKLKRLDLGFEVSQEWQTYVAGDHGDLRFVDENALESGYVYWIPLAVNLDELDQLPDETEDVVVRFNDKAVLDCSVFSRFKKMKTLTLWGDVNYVMGTDGAYNKETMFELQNVQALSGNPELFALNVSGAFGDFSGIGELGQLKELSVYGCILEDPSFLSSLSSLRELRFRHNYAVGLEKYVNGDNLPKLTYLNANNTAFKKSDQIAEMKSLKMLCLMHTPNILKWEGNPVVTVKEVAKCENVKYLCLELEEAGSISSLKQLKNLEYLYLRGGEEFSGEKNVIELPELYGVTIFGGSKIDVNECNRLLEAAGKRENLSVCVIARFSDNFGVMGMRNGKEAVKEFAKELQKGFQACQQGHVLCQGYEALMKYFQLDSAEELEAFLAE